MSDMDATTPRVFLLRHGETEWTKNGRYTGITDIELTPLGELQVTGTGSKIVGKGKLIDPTRTTRIWVSPRKRARRTFELAFGTSAHDSSIADKVILTEQIREWDYGDYEGLVVGEIKARRKERGLDQDREYNIWKDGCEGGESPQQVTERLDRLITEIREIQGPYMNGERPVDVVLVAHGLILRAFAKRWLRLALEDPLPMIMSPGAVAILSYKNHDVNEPGFHIGLALPSENS